MVIVGILLAIIASAGVALFLRRDQGKSVLPFWTVLVVAAVGLVGGLIGASLGWFGALYLGVAAGVGVLFLLIRLRRGKKAQPAPPIPAALGRKLTADEAVARALEELANAVPPAAAVTPPSAQPAVPSAQPAPAPTPPGATPPTPAPSPPSSTAAPPATPAPAEPTEAAAPPAAPTPQPAAASPPAAAPRPAQPSPPATPAAPSMVETGARPLSVFLSYRQQDAADAAGRIYDALRRELRDARLFMDIDTIPPGVDFVEHINKAVGGCDVFIAVIGKQWLKVRDRTRVRRLDLEGDFVRLEIAAALERDIRVIPALVQGASMPRPSDLPEPLRALAYRMAIDLSANQFGSGIKRLIEELETMRGTNSGDAEKTGEPKAGT